MTYPRFLMARGHKSAVRTSGNISMGTTSWTNLDTGLDITIHATVGDVLLAMCEFQVLCASGNDVFFDIATVVAGSPVNYFSLGTSSQANRGLPSMYVGNFLTNVAFSLSGLASYPVQSSDLVSGSVTLRLRYKNNGPTPTLTLYADNGATYTPARWRVWNLGPVDPN